MNKNNKNELIVNSDNFDVVKLTQDFVKVYDDSVMEIIENASTLQPCVDDETYKSYKNLRADIKKKVDIENSDKRKVEKVFTQMLDTYKEQTVSTTLSEAHKIVDKYVKDYENILKEEKQFIIDDMFLTHNANPKIEMKHVFNKTWLNQTKKIKEIEFEMRDKLDEINGNLSLLNDDEQKLYLNGKSMQSILIAREEDNKVDITVKLVISQPAYQRLCSYLEREGIEYDFQ